MSKALKIFLVDDHRMLRDGLVGYFDNALKYEIVGEAGDGAEALDRIKAIEVDVVLTDIQMPKMDGIALTTAVTIRRFHVSAPNESRTRPMNERKK